MVSDIKRGATWPSASDSVPTGLVAVPLTPEQVAAPIKICIFLRPKTENPTALAGLKVLRDTFEARVLLGAIADAEGAIHQWLEVWVQTPSNAAGAPAAVLDSISNSVLDDRWMQMVRGYESVDRGGVVRTGWEAEPLTPVWIDPNTSEPVNAVDLQSGDIWTLCRDETLLAKAGLPGYASSLHRYLYLPKLGEASSFVAVSLHAPSNDRVVAVQSILGGRLDLIPLNVGGRMMIRVREPVTMEEFSDFLSENPNIVPNCSSVLSRRSPASASGPWANDGWLLMGPQGRRGRLLESLHLKLRLLADAVAAVRTVVERTQRPLLDLDLGSFQVRLGEIGPALPFLWSAHAVLSHGGSAVALPIAGSQARYYVQGRVSGAAIYRPTRVGEPLSGRGTARVRKLISEGATDLVLEGTLASDARIECAVNDLLWIRISGPNGPIDLYANVGVEPGLPAGEVRFRTVSQQLPDNAIQHLRAAEGVPTPASFQVLPVLSSPCDLYSLAVLAIRLLLVNGESALPASLDDLLSFARQVAQKYEASSPLRLRVSAIFDSDPRWPAVLGPQRLTWDKVPLADVRDVVPHGVWIDILAMLVAMFPGIGPDSVCADYGAAPAGALHRVFERTSQLLDNLLLRTRSLIVVDWRYNREIAAVIRAELTALSAKRAPPA